MIRKKPKIPKNEIVRNYRRERDLLPRDFLFDSDYVDNDKQDKGEAT